MTTVTGELYVVRITYSNVVNHARPVPNCPVCLLGRLGLRYALAFFETSAQNVDSKLQFLGVLHEGACLDYVKAVLAGGTDVLDEAAQWLFPNGEVRCCSVRALQQMCDSGSSSGDSVDDFGLIAEAFGYKYLGGQCDVAELLEDKATLKDQRWTA